MTFASDHSWLVRGASTQTKKRAAFACARRRPVRKIRQGTENTQAGQAGAVTYPAAVEVSGQVVRALRPTLAGFHRLVDRLLH